MMNFLRRLWNALFRRKQVEVKKPVDDVHPADPVEPDPNGEGWYKLVEVVNASESEAHTAGRAVLLVERVVRHPSFKTMVMDAKFTSTGGKTNAEIYDIFTKSQVPVKVSMFTGTYMQNKVWKTVGFDDVNDDYVHANRYFVQDEDTLASLIIHEVAHALGFSHASASEYTSVPYQMNRICEAVIEKLKGSA